jgi:acetoin utilization deacetylase AcuC-like enzyme
LLILARAGGPGHHDGGIDHPEQPARLTAVMAGIDDLRLGGELVSVQIEPASSEALERVHAATYLRGLRASCQRGGGQLDPDTYIRPDSWDVAVSAAGAGLAVVAELQQRREGIGFVAARPPGHHADRHRAMGFCLINNVAVAAAALVADGNRVLIVDWDVHHGNGTQSIFWDDPDVLYVSTHQWPLFPGTGRATEVGGADALGLTLNVPLPPGATGDIVRMALEWTAGPTIDAFAPDWVLISCGFDAHRDDPLGSLALSSGDFSSLARLVETYTPAPGRLLLFLEGGYDFSALRSSVAASIGALLGDPSRTEPGTTGGPGRDDVLTAEQDRRRALAGGGGPKPEPG